MEKIEQQIEKLAIAVANGFEQQERRFDAIFEQFRDVDERFKVVDERFDEMGARFDNLEHRLSGLREDVLEVRLAVKELREISISLDEQAELRRRLVRVEDHLGLPHELPPEPAM